MGTKTLTAEEIAELRKFYDGIGVDKVSGKLGGALLHAFTAVPRLLDFAERSRALLKRIEWEGWECGQEGLCPECRGLDVHRPGCELAALIAT